jgi:hypothetical protein
MIRSIHNEIYTYMGHRVLPLEKKLYPEPGILDAEDTKAPLIYYPEQLRFMHTNHETEKPLI